MAGRAIWKGIVRLGAASVPVKLYSAVQDRDVHFTLLERKHHTRVQQRMVKPESDDPVQYDQIRRGYLSEGSYVMLEREELSQLAPQPSRDIGISRCVEPDELGPEWLIRPYYLGPDGDAQGFVALRQALDEAGRAGVAHWVMRGVEYSGLLKVEEGQLLLVTLRHPDEVIAQGHIPLPSGREHNEKEAQMAEQLVLAFEGAFDPKQYHNQHRERLLALVDAKATGRRVRLKPVHEKSAPASLADALRASLAAQRKTGASKPRAPAHKRVRARKERAVA